MVRKVLFCARSPKELNTWLKISMSATREKNKRRRCSLNVPLRSLVSHTKMMSEERRKKEKKRLNPPKSDTKVIRKRKE